MKKLILTVAAVLAAGVFAMPAGFTDGWDAALKKAAAEKKPAAAKKETKTWHITKNVEKNKWQVKATENDKATRLFNTKAEAEEYVKTLKANNQGSRVVTHKKDGKFQKK